MARMEVEADSLFQQISRLTNNNTSLSSQLTELKTATTLTTTSTSPLQYELLRLKSELESLNAHSQWLESELSTRSDQNTQLRIQRSNTEQTLTRKNNALILEREDMILELESVKGRYERCVTRLDGCEVELREGERKYADKVQEMEMEIQAERRLVQLNRENAIRMEERYNDTVREIESMKSLANVAIQEHVRDVERVRQEIQMDAARSLQDCNKENEREINQLKDRLQITLTEKTKLEDDFMSGSRTKNSNRNLPAIANGPGGSENKDLLQLEYTAGNGQPMSLTDVYEKLAETDEEARHERAERRRTELLLERIQREIEISVPKRNQERREYERSLKQMVDLQERLQDALQESEAAKVNLKQTQMEGRETTHECRELRLENEDLARQVQSLLRNALGRSSAAAMDAGGDGDEDFVTFGSAEEMQNQNQRLLREHHRLTSYITELEEKLNTETLHIRLREVEGSLKDLLEERDTQATLVASIVQQRDLYRALLAKNDAQLLASTTTGTAESTALVVMKDRDEKYALVEGENAELEETIAKLKAELSTSVNVKTGLEERLLRLDTLSEDLTESMKTQQRELSAAQASTARKEAELSYTKQVVGRLEDSLTAAKNDVERVSNSKRELQQMNEDLQSALSASRADSIKRDEDLRQTTVQLSLAETKLLSLQAAESRLAGENNSLRSEMSKHTALHESMQKIEASISSRADEERERLCEEGRRLNAMLISERDKCNAEIETMQNKIADVDIRANALEKKGVEANTNMITAKKDAVAAQAEVLLLNEKCKSLEEALNTATIKIGANDDTNTSDQDKLISMVTDLDVTRADLAASKKQLGDYRSISKVNENALADSMKTTEDYKEKMTAEIQKLTTERNRAQLTAQLKQEALEELSTNYTNGDEEKEKLIKDLKENSEILRTEVKMVKDDNKYMTSQVDGLVKEMNMYKTDAVAATNNYERELVLHASARTSLINSRLETEKEIQLRRSLTSQLDQVKAEITSEKDIWDETKLKLGSAEQSAHTKLEALQQQNNILHSQIAALAETVEKYQSERLASISEVAESMADKAVDQSDAENIAFQKQISELREIVSFMRSERETLDSQLLSARRSIERERATAEVLKHSLEESRAELTIIQKSAVDGIGGTDDSFDRMEKTLSNLKQNEEQLVLMRESNQLLREETEKLNKSLSMLEKDLHDTKLVFEPTVQKSRELEVDKAALEAEKLSLAREVEAWKGRVKSLVSKFHQIDPEEHSKALTQLEESKKECATLQSAKEQAGKETSSAKALITRLNKDIAKQRETTESIKAALEKMTTQKADAVAARDDLDSIKTMKASVDIELESYKDRVNRLKEMLRSNKTTYGKVKKKLDEKVILEKETNARLNKLEESNKKLEESKKSLLKEVERIKLLEESKRATRSKDPPLATSTDIVVSTQPHPIKDLMNSSTLAPPVSEQISNQAITESTSTDEILGSAQKILKVPSEGFMFAPSAITSPHPASLSFKTNSTETNVAAQSEESVHGGNMSKADGKNPDSSVTINEKEACTSLPSKSAQSITHVGVIIPPKESSGHSVENVGIITNTGPERANTLPKVSVSKEESLREKIMKKKRHLAQLKGGTPPADVAKRVRADSTATAASGSTRPVQDESMSSESITQTAAQTSCNAGTKVQYSMATLKETQGPPIELKKFPASSSIGSNIPPTTSIFGSGLPTSTGTTPQGLVFGNAVTSLGANITSSQTSEASNKTLTTFPSSASGTFLNLKPPGSDQSKPLVFGKSASIASGSFLNLKPPGSGQSKPLVFGKSANITLPTPSKTSKTALDSMKEQSFGVFGVQSQASSLGCFPSSGTPNLSFGGVVNKKRTHEDDANEVSETKLARLEESDEKEGAGLGEASVRVKTELGDNNADSEA